jgi:hypothetical protein
MASLAEIRSRLAAAENKQSGNQQQGDSAIYPHWNIPDNSAVTLRFLPDGNSKNTFFWQERAMIRLPFNGIKGELESKPVQVRIPCMEMWNETCPVLTEVRTWFKDKSLEEMGRKYWKKRDYIFQGFVRDNPLQEDKAPENPIRRFIIGPQIFTLIKGALMDPELEELPTDYLRGLDFRVSKGSKGGFADYSGSKWARKESALSEAEQAAIEQYGLVDLSTFLPKKPGDVELKVIKEMFEASVDGQSYDAERWSAYFRPAGVAAPSGISGSSSADDSDVPVSKPAPVAKPAVVSDFDDDEEDMPVAQSPVKTVEPKQNAQDILALIRARQKQ